MDAAGVQGRALGFDPAYVFIPHPVQDRTDAELQALADGHLDAILALLTRGPGEATASDSSAGR